MCNYIYIGVVVANVLLIGGSVVIPTLEATQVLCERSTGVNNESKCLFIRLLLHPFV